MPNPPATDPTPTTCQARSTDGHPCTLEHGHPSVILPGVTPSERNPDGSRIPTVRHLTESGKTFATRRG